MAGTTRHHKTHGGRPTCPIGCGASQPTSWPPHRRHPCSPPHRGWGRPTAHSPSPPSWPNPWLAPIRVGGPDPIRSQIHASDSSIFINRENKIHCRSYVLSRHILINFIGFSTLIMRIGYLSTIWLQDNITSIKKALCVISINKALSIFWLIHPSIHLSTHPFWN